MLNLNELTMLVIGIATLAFIIYYWTKIKRIQSWKILIVAFSLILCSWVATVAEVFFLPGLINFVEHFCNAAGILLFAIWSFISLPVIIGKLENE
jgi:hypothetical protein